MAKKFIIPDGKKYPPKILDNALKRKNKVDRLKAIKRVEKTKEDTMVLVTTCHPLCGIHFNKSGHSLSEIQAFAFERFLKIN